MQITAALAFSSVCVYLHGQPSMPAKKKANAKPLTGAALIKELCHCIRVVRNYFAHLRTSLTARTSASSCFSAPSGRINRDCTPALSLRLPADCSLKLS
jgi:hypothetical protein